MNTIIKVIENKDFDRVIILHIDESRCEDYADGIVGINFYQGDYNVDVTAQFMNINPHITEIWRRLTLNHPNVPYMFLVNQAVEFYCDAFIHQDIRFHNVPNKVDNSKINTTQTNPTYLIPSSQLAVIQKALLFYVEQSNKLNSCPTESESYDLFDMQQLSAMLNYPISITISDSDKANFSGSHGMDFPQYAD